METMYERVQRMTPMELAQFVYWTYMCGNKDGQLGLKDSKDGFFCMIMAEKANDIMPNDSIADLWDKFKEVYEV